MAQTPDICSPMPAACLKSVTNSTSLEKLARLRRDRGQPAGKEGDSETSDENEPSLVPKSARGGFWTTTPPPARFGRSREGKLEESPEAKSCEALAAGRSHQTALGKFLKSVKERALHLVENVEVNDARVAHRSDCFVLGVQHHHGSQLLAAVKDRWPSFSRFGSSRLPKNHPHVAVCTLILRIAYIRLSDLLALKQKDPVPSLVPLLP